VSYVIGWGYLLLGIGGAFNASRYSYEEWRTARCDKNFWLVALAVFGPVFILPYVLAVKPRLRTARLVAPKRKVS
jgi:hypothetical protein